MKHTFHSNKNREKKVPCISKPLAVPTIIRYSNYSDRKNDGECIIRVKKLHCARLPGSIMNKIGDTRPIFIEHNTKQIRKSRWYRPYTPCQRSPHTRSIVCVWIPSHIANITDLQNKKVSNRKSYTISSHNHTHLMKKHTLAEFHVERATPRARFLAREKIRESAKFNNLKNTYLWTAVAHAKNVRWTSTQAQPSRACCVWSDAIKVIGEWPIWKAPKPRGRIPPSSCLLSETLVK